MVNQLLLSSEPVETPEECDPRSCGQHAIVKPVETYCVCECKPGFLGVPPSCRPECVVTPECPLDKACVNNKCINPCADDVCGTNARCSVIHHNPICSCLVGYTGDPLDRCCKSLSKWNVEVFVSYQMYFSSPN